MDEGFKRVKRAIPFVLEGVRNWARGIFLVWSLEGYGSGYGARDKGLRGFRVVLVWVVGS